MSKKFLKSYNRFKMDESYIDFNYNYREEDETEIPEIPQYIEDEFCDSDNDAIINNQTTLSTSPREFSVIKLMTSNGEKVAMCYTSDNEYGIGSEICSNLDFKSAISKVKEICKNGISEFNKDNDEILGSIPKFMIDKSVKNISSYRPLKESLKELKSQRDEIRKMRYEISNKINTINKNLDAVQSDIEIPEEIKEVRMEEITAHLESLKRNYKMLGKLL